MTHTPVYEIDDLGLVVALGLQRIHSHEKETIAGRCVFRFEDSEHVREIAAGFYNGTLMVPAFLFSLVLRNLAQSIAAERRKARQQRERPHTPETSTRS